MSLRATTSQTVGPYFRIGLSALYTPDLVGPDVSGERIHLEGKIFDGLGNTVPDAVIEIWQANSYGKYAHPDDWQDQPIESAFRGWGRVPTDESGEFSFHTIRPGSVPGPDESWQAPHLEIAILMRGLLRHLVTRVYFSDELANASDPVLNLLEPSRRRTLIAKKMGEKRNVFRWDVHLQGQDETVFLDV